MYSEVLPGTSEHVAGQYNALVHSDTVAAPLEAAHNNSRTVSRRGIGRDGGCVAGDGEAVLGEREAASVVKNESNNYSLVFYRHNCDSEHEYEHRYERERHRSQPQKHKHENGDEVKHEHERVRA